MKNLPLRWGILGTGRIVRQFIAALAESGSGTAVASGSRNAESAALFQKDFGHVRCHASYRALIDDPDLDAIYVATPHPFHLEWATAALNQKIPVLCEKPLAMNFAEAQAMVDAARTNQCALTEAFRYRFHPQTHKLCELLGSDIIGTIRQIHASFCFSAPPDPTSRVFDPNLGASAILDVGCYSMSMVRLLAGAIRGKEFENPVHMQGMTALIPDFGHVDRSAIANLRFPGGILAQIRCGVGSMARNSVEIEGSEGRIEISTPWSCSPAGEPAAIHIYKSDRSETVEVVSPWSAMAHEASAFADLVHSGALESRWMRWEDSLGNLAAMDAWRTAVD